MNIDEWAYLASRVIDHLVSRVINHIVVKRANLHFMEHLRYVMRV